MESNDIITILNKLSNISIEILDKINKLDERITSVEKKIELVLPLLNNNISMENLKELKNEELEINKNEIIRALLFRDYRSIIHIFRIFYKNKLNEKYSYPIRITGKRSYEYYCNNKWNPDLYGYHSMNIICLNIQNLFIKYNDIDEMGYENFILNQNFIYKLSDEKYKKNVFKNIIEEVRINNL